MTELQAIKKSIKHWKEVTRSVTWEEWSVHAKTMIKQLESLLPRKE